MLQALKNNLAISNIIFFLVVMSFNQSLNLRDELHLLAWILVSYFPSILANHEAEALQNNETFKRQQ